MKVLTNANRAIVREHLDEYLKHPYLSPRGQQIARTKAWAMGTSIAVLSDNGKVSREAVRSSIASLVPLVLRYANEHTDSHYGHTIDVTGDVPYCQDCETEIQDVR